MGAQKAGWYPDPNNDNSEVYWDGTRWHGRRDKLHPQAPTQRLSSTPSAAPTVKLRDRLATFWASADDTRRALLIFGGIIATALIAGLVGFVVSELSESPYKDECVAVAERNGYSADSPAVDACIRYGEEFGHT